ncbi:hypothetical protein ACO2Q7_03670 [Rathayibacter sp. KR2-224]|uniref:hypothetical protein n=1 Tax=Rathayibacter sp. KR2-224 TaxID=3400913 RepID=UPI003BFFC980
MFGRRRHAAVPVAPIAAVAPAAAPLPRLAEEQIFELVHTRIAAAIGEGGEWVVRRRTPEDTDELFRTVLAHQVALDVTNALRNAQSQLEAGEQLTVATRAGTVPLASGAGGEASDALAAAGDAAEQPEISANVGEGMVIGSSAEGAAEDDSEQGPAHRQHEPQGDDAAELDEDAIALQWEPAPITVWTDLKRPVTGPVATQQTAADAVAAVG